MFKKFQQNLINEISEHKTSYDYLQLNIDDVTSRASPELAATLTSEFKSLQTRYSEVKRTVDERKVRIEKAIHDLKIFQEDYNKAFNWISRIEAFIMSEQAAIGDAKLLNTQVEQLKNIAKDIESIQMIINRLNEIAKELLSAQCDIKFAAKLKSDINELNEKMNNLVLLNKRHNQNLNVNRLRKYFLLNKIFGNFFFINLN